MEESYYWNIHQEHHPKNRLLKYSKSSKIPKDIIQRLLHIRKTYSKLPPIIYSIQDSIETQDIILENDIFGQRCHLSLQNKENIWEPTEFYVPDDIYRQLKTDLFSWKIDGDLIFLSLFPIYADINHKKQLTMGNQDEEIYLPSKTPSTKYDLYQLEERFHRMLFDEHALEIGLCSKRRRIYNDLFDELIRLITLQCSERGILLGRIKNEYLRWMNTYEEIYTSGMAFALREYLYKIEEKQKYEYYIKQLENDCKQLHDDIEQESIRYDKLNQLIFNDHEYEQNPSQRLLRNNLQILRSTNEILRRDLQNTLNNILSSTIFLGEPIDYDKDVII